ncbi:hypothetical protein HYU06_06550 [Candidatus Woesearchaeota archaeon]|nr:hypothetical protein [Candidatus Woesearchaeota archaeon]
MKFLKSPLSSDNQIIEIAGPDVCEQKVAEKMFKRKFARLEDALGAYLT